ncbi:MAG: 16S rRNA (cytosine(967)-C(5))-methyltransferase RsmB [Alicyclobacillaceae bacterium]|nr:16S rRNA (cytosine(967)-C(5))-methyltransferase RsmB [Alicyclobacillaceae bacterium]
MGPRSTHQTGGNLGGVKEEGRVSPAREIAFQVLLQVEEHHAYSHIALQQALARKAVGRLDAALATELVYGTLQWQQWLDARIARYSRRSPDRLDLPARVALRMAAYQLLKLTRVAPYAAVDEAVELVKRRRPRAAAFVNGVLRSLLRDPGGSESGVGESGGCGEMTPERLAEVTSHPLWMVRRWCEEFGLETTARLCRSNNERPPFALRANRLRTSARELAAALGRRGIAADPSPVFPDAVRMADGADVSRLDLFQAGYFTVQDESAMLAVACLNPSPGWRVLDLCAGPGGKTTHLAEWMEDRGEVVAVDIHPHRVELIRGAAKRLGLNCIRPVCADGRGGEWEEGFDGVLVDAPCSGLGVLRRRPELKWRRTPRDVAQLAALQRELLSAGARAVGPGGVLVYATCTVMKAENDDVVSAFLQGPGGRTFQPEDPTRQWPEGALAGVHRTTFGVQVFPFQFGGDGFYFARLRRISG